MYVPVIEILLVERITRILIHVVYILIYKITVYCTSIATSVSSEAALKM